MKQRQKKNESEATPGQAENAGAAAPQGAAAPVAESQPEAKAAAEERFLRLMADFDNFRKRTQRERGEVYQQAHADLVTELLPVIDHLELALKAAADRDQDDAMVEGFRLVAEQILAAIKRLGVLRIEAESKVFDPAMHEAMATLPSTAVPEGSVISEMRKGYLLGSRLLRPAQVVVSSGTPEPEPAAEPPAPNEG